MGDVDTLFSSLSLPSSDDILEAIRQTIKPYLVPGRKKGRLYWHWYHDWAKAEIMILGKRLGFKVSPEFPVANPFAKSGKGRIDVVWLDQVDKLQVAIEIVNRMPLFRDVGKLSNLGGTCLAVIVSLHDSGGPIYRRLGSTQPKARSWVYKYDELDLGNVWYIHARAKPMLFSDWLEKTRKRVPAKPRVVNELVVRSLYCESCESTERHKLKKHMGNYAWWLCVRCGKERPGPLPARLKQ